MNAPRILYQNRSQRNEERMWTGFATFRIRSNSECDEREHSTDTHRSTTKIRNNPFPTSVHHPPAQSCPNSTRNFAVAIKIILASRNSRWKLAFWKICVSLFSTHLIQVMRVRSAAFRQWQGASLVTSSRWCCHESWRWVPTQVPRTSLLARSQVVNIPLNWNRRVFVICDVSLNYDRHYTDLHSSAMEVPPTPNTPSLLLRIADTVFCHDRLISTDHWYPTTVVNSLPTTSCIKYVILATSFTYPKVRKIIDHTYV